MITVTAPEQKPKDVKPFPKLMQSKHGEIFYMINKTIGLPFAIEVEPVEASVPQTEGI